MSRSVSVTPFDLDREKRILFAQFDSEYGFKEDQSRYLKEKFNERIRGTDPSSYHRLFEGMRYLGEERKQRLERHANVLRQQAEVAKISQDPTNIDTNAAVAEMQNRISLEGQGSRWKSEEDRFDPAFYHIRDDEKDKIEQIISNRGPVTQLGVANFSSELMPSNSLAKNIASSFLPFPASMASWRQANSYPRLLKKARAQTRAAICEINWQIDNFLETGQVRDAPKNVVASSNPFVNSDVAHDIAAGVNRLLSFVTNQKRDPKKTADWAKFERYRNNVVLPSLLHRISPNDTKHAELFRKYKQIIEQGQADGTGLLDPAAFNKLMALFENEIKAANAGNEAQNEEMMKKVNEINQKMYEAVKDKTADADDMRMARVAQLFLMISPFAGIAYMGPVLNVFSGVFQNAGGIAQGISSLASSDFWGPLGKVAEFLRIDDLIEWFLEDMPIIGNIFDITDEIVGSNIGQTVIGGGMSVLSGPAIPVIVGAAYCFPRLKNEMQHFEKHGPLLEKHTKSLADEVNKLLSKMKDPESFYKLDSAEALIDKKFDIYKEDYVVKTIALFVQHLYSHQERGSNKGDYLKMLLDDNIVSNGMTLSEILIARKIIDEDNETIDQKKLLEFLSEHKEIRQQIDQMLLLFYEVGRADEVPPTMNQIIDEVKEVASDPVRSKLYRENATESRDLCFLEASQENYPDIHPLDRTKDLQQEAKRLTEEMKKADLDDIDNLGKLITNDQTADQVKPSLSPADPKGFLLGSMLNPAYRRSGVMAL